MPIKEEFIIKARHHFAAIDLQCIEDAKSGKEKVNDLESYVQWNMDSYHRCMAGEFDHSFTHLQFAHYLQTGIMVALLP